MRNGSHLGWTCSVHIVSDSTIVFKDKSGPAKPSLLPEYSLRNSVFGIVQEAMGGAQIAGIVGASSRFRWEEN
eukprot:9273741-Pyramimonas_sp.AAC.1